MILVCLKVEGNITLSFLPVYTTVYKPLILVLTEALSDTGLSEGGREYHPVFLTCVYNCL